MSINPKRTQWTITRSKLGSAIGEIAAWTWTVLAGGGGLLLLLEKGPRPLTNGWFALFSGVSACPLASSLSKRYAGVTVSGRVRFAAAAAFFIAGKIALGIEGKSIFF
jgi:hypothetical protein